MNESLILSQIGSSALVVFLLQKAKESKWFPFLTTETAKLNRVVAVIAAGLVSVGVHTTFDKSAGTLVITGLTVSGILHGLWAWLNSYAVQHSIYKVTTINSIPAASK